jgi:hypothetical protein
MSNTLDTQLLATAHPLQLLRQLAVADQEHMHRRALPEKGLPPALDPRLPQQALRFRCLHSQPRQAGHVVIGVQHHG